MRRQRGLVLVGLAAAAAWWFWRQQPPPLPAGASPQTGQPTVAYVPRRLNPCQGCGGSTGLMQWTTTNPVGSIGGKFGAGSAAPVGGWSCVCGL